MAKKTATIETAKLAPMNNIMAKPAAEPAPETVKAAASTAFSNKINLGGMMGGIKIPVTHGASPVQPTPKPVTPSPTPIKGPWGTWGPKYPTTPIPTTPPPPPPTGASVQFKVLDKMNNEPIYKCALSIKGTNNNRIFEIESNETGIINQYIPLGDYSIELRIDDYAVLQQNFSVTNSNPLTLEYKLQREEVKFKSFFLIGMICERMPKIPMNP
jgi:hypothetical protein